MRYSKEFIVKQCWDMKVGQCINFLTHDLMDAFQIHPFLGEYRTWEDAFMGSMIGSSYGSYTLDANPINRTHTICRHECKDKRVWVPTHENDDYEYAGGEYISHRAIEIAYQETK